MKKYLLENPSRLGREHETLKVKRQNEQAKKFFLDAAFMAAKTVMADGAYSPQIISTARSLYNWVGVYDLTARDIKRCYNCLEAIKRATICVKGHNKTEKVFNDENNQVPVREWCDKIIDEVTAIQANMKTTYPEAFGDEQD